MLHFRPTMILFSVACLSTFIQWVSDAFLFIGGCIPLSQNAVDNLWNDNRSTKSNIFPGSLSPLKPLLQENGGWSLTNWLSPRKMQPSQSATFNDEHVAQNIQPSLEEVQEFITTFNQAAHQIQPPLSHPPSSHPSQRALVCGFEDFDSKALAKKLARKTSSLYRGKSLNSVVSFGKSSIKPNLFSD